MADILVRGQVIKSGSSLDTASAKNQYFHVSSFLKYHILQLIGADPHLSPLWQECGRRGMGGVDSGALHYPLQGPGELAVKGFVLPAQLVPVRFQLARFFKNGVVKIFKNAARKG